MASIVEPTATPTAEGDHQPPVVAWFEKNRKVVSYTALAVAAVAVGTWLFIETGRRKTAAAADALQGAQAAFDGGNLPAASAAYQQVAQGYSGTDAAYQAEIGLNEVRLASGQTQLAVDELRKFIATNPPAYFVSAAYTLVGGALENLKKFDDAAKAYAQAAGAAAEDYRKVDALLGEARAYRLAGKPKEAADALRGIVGKFPKETPGMAEAEVRLAELTKGVM
jgi:tetratricopeptide (TPR) repeat protein